MGRLSGKVAVVTGGGSGIGLATAHRFLAEGAVVEIWDLRPCEIVRAAVVDVRNASAVRSAAERLVGETGRIDILINGAGVTGGYLDALTLPENVWRIILETNLTGALNAVQAVVPGMKEQRYGRIMNVTSVLDRYGFPGQSAYVASKAALAGLTRVWAREFGPFGITVNAVSPGYIDTPMNAKNGPEFVQRAVERTPLGRIGTVEDVTGAFVFLASDEASFVTGAILPVDGGLIP